MKIERAGKIERSGALNERALTLLAPLTRGRRAVFSLVAAAAAALLSGSALGVTFPEAALNFQPEATAADMASARALSRVFQSVAKKAEPAVVHIRQFSKVPQFQRDNFGFQRMAEAQLQETGLGSGVIVSADGYILTNNHVAQNVETLLVRLLDRRELEAKVIGRDPDTDLALLKIDANNLSYVEFADSDSVEVGEWLLAIGSPFGFSNTVTSGIVSAKGRSGIGGLQGYQDFIQTDAAVNPGNSGGPMLNLEGKIIGINSAIASRSGGYQGISFAIPSNIAKSIVESIIKTGRVTRGWLGVDLADTGMNEPNGTRRGAAPEVTVTPNGTRRGAAPEVTVTRVMEKSPAEKAGLKQGDVVLTFRGREIDNIARLRTQIALTPPDTTVPIEIRRDGKKLTLDVKIGDQATGVAEAVGGAYARKAGLVFQTLDKDLATRSGYRNVSGVLVVSIDQMSRAASAEMEIGDIIVAINDRRVTTAEEAAEALNNADYAQGVRMSVIRKNMRGSLMLQD